MNEVLVRVMPSHFGNVKSILERESIVIKEEFGRTSILVCIVSGDEQAEYIRRIHGVVAVRDNFQFRF